MDDRISYIFYGFIGACVLVGITAGLVTSSFDIGTFLVVIQSTIVVIALVIGVFSSFKDPAEVAPIVLKIATASMIYLPISLAMFSIFGSVIFQNANFLIPVIAGIIGVVLNLVIDKTGVISYLSSFFTKK